MTNHNGTVNEYQLRKFAQEQAQMQAMAQLQQNERNHRLVMTIAKCGATLLSNYPPEQHTRENVVRCAQNAADMVSAAEMVFNQRVAAAEAAAKEKATAKEAPKVTLT